MDISYGLRNKKTNEVVWIGFTRYDRKSNDCPFCKADQCLQRVSKSGEVENVQHFEVSWPVEEEDE